MAGRTNYTYTAIYNRSFAKPGKFGSAGYDERALAFDTPRSHASRDDSDGRSDTPVLALLFFVMPILGLFAILIQPMRWVFAGAAALSMLTMWGLKCFMHRARLITSGLLMALMALSVVGALMDPGALSGGPVSNLNLNGTNNLTYASGLIGDDFSTIQPSVTTDAAAAVSPDSPMALAEATLTAYLDLWKLGNDMDGMLQLTWPQWRTSLDNALFTLNLSVRNRKLTDWEFTVPAISDLDNVVTVPVLAHHTSTSQVSTTYRYSAILYRVDGKWYVDPNSFKSGVQELTATPSPDPDATPKPTPQPVISGTDKLWYNSEGGQLYHTKKDCPSIATRYHSKMSSFTYSQLKDKKYSKYNPCKVCGAPARP